MSSGGNNPHSLVHDDAPEHTLQESSFQPAGAQNPMPSVSYDFFAPLGEFGQPRPHYHSMRRLHHMVLRFGADLAATVATLPAGGAPSKADNSTLRWSVRSNGRGGFLFVNNYERLATLSEKPNVRFLLRWSTGGGDPLIIPSNLSAPLTIPPAAWFVWPFGLRLFTTHNAQLTEAQLTEAQLAWATAQLLTEVRTSASASVLFLVETDGVLPEVGLAVADSHLIHHAGSAHIEGAHTVIRGLTPGYEPIATLQMGAQTTSIVLLPSVDADRAWTLELAGETRLMISHQAELLLADGDRLHTRAPVATEQLTVLMCPSVASLHVVGGAAVPAHTEGVFTSFSFAQAAPKLPQTLETKLTKHAGPPRQIPRAPSGKPQEPTAEEWLAAAEYTVELDQVAAYIHGSAEVRLAIDYAADCARIYLGERLLTDNWLSGYYGTDGAMEVGLSYLSGELLLNKSATLRLVLLPLRRSSLETDIWLQPAHWPSFDGNESVCRLDAVRVLGLQYTELRAAAPGPKPEATGR